MWKTFRNGVISWGIAMLIAGWTIIHLSNVDWKVILQWWVYNSWSYLVEKVSDLYEILDTAYYDRTDLDIESMQQQALKGFVDAIWDPYTVYLSPEENEIFDEWMQWSQNFDGIGAVVTDADEWVLIEAVLKWSPAFKSWLEPLDVILQIEGELTKPLWLNEAVQKIRGPKDTPVVLTILREGAEQPIFDVTVTRGAISVPSAEAEIIERDGKRLLFLTISIFGDDTMRVIRNELRQLGLSSNSALDWIIIDLRWNGGGYLPVAVEVSSIFLPKNEQVVTAKYSIFDDESFKSQWYSILPRETEIVVLIDGLSASASEIVALALQERADATILWTQSFGKGSIQTLQSNNDGSSLKLTIWRRYAPSGETIDEIGIVPDRTVEFDIEAYLEDETDSQRNAAVEFLVWLDDNE